MLLSKGDVGTRERRIVVARAPAAADKNENSKQNLNKSKRKSTNNDERKNEKRALTLIRRLIIKPYFARKAKSKSLGGAEA